MIELVIGVGGVILGFVLTMLWDRYKNRSKYKDLLEMVLFELRNTKKRATDSLNRLPEPMRRELEEKDYVDLPPELIQQAPFTFPKPYTTDAWNTLVASGFLANVPRPLLTELFAVYDQISSFNYLGQISIELFKIISRDNNLSPDTNMYIASGCRMVTFAPLWAVHRKIDRVIEMVESESR
jgi:hypothetical protein